MSSNCKDLTSEKEKQSCFLDKIYTDIDDEIEIYKRNVKESLYSDDEKREIEEKMGKIGSKLINPIPKTKPGIIRRFMPEDIIFSIFMLTFIIVGIIICIYIIKTYTHTEYIIEGSCCVVMDDGSKHCLGTYPEKQENGLFKQKPMNNIICQSKYGGIFHEQPCINEDGIPLNTCDQYRGYTTI